MVRIRKTGTEWPFKNQPIDFIRAAWKIDKVEPEERKTEYKTLWRKNNYENAMTAWNKAGIFRTCRKRRVVR